MRIVFMGTPEFACPSLEMLLARADSVVGVVCQPDRPKGRGLRRTPPPVKQLAERHGVPVLQPTHVRDRRFPDALAALAPELIVVAAYGRILPRAVLDLPAHGCVNVHASLLPRHRGAAPIAGAILAGDATTGVTIMRMAEGLDTGDILLTRETPVTPTDTTGSLTTRLATLGADLLAEAIDGLAAGTLVARAQREADATYAPRLERDQRRVDWRRPATELDRLVRALTPRPGAFTTLTGRRLGIGRAEPEPHHAGGPPGTVLEATPAGVVVATGAGALRLLEVQLEGRRTLPVAQFLVGHPLTPGTCLGVS